MTYLPGCAPLSVCVPPIRTPNSGNPGIRAPHLGLSPAETKTSEQERFSHALLACFLASPFHRLTSARLSTSLDSALLCHGLNLDAAPPCLALPHLDLTHLDSASTDLGSASLCLSTDLDSACLASVPHFNSAPPCLGLTGPASAQPTGLCSRSIEKAPVPTYSQPASDTCSSTD